MAHSNWVIEDILVKGLFAKMWPPQGVRGPDGTVPRLAQCRESLVLGAGGDKDHLPLKRKKHPTSPSLPASHWPIPT